MNEEKNKGENLPPRAQLLLAGRSLAGCLWGSRVEARLVRAWPILWEDFLCRLWLNSQGRPPP